MTDQDSQNDEPISEIDPMEFACMTLLMPAAESTFLLDGLDSSNQVKVMVARKLISLALGKDETGAPPAILATIEAIKEFNNRTMGKAD